METNITSYTQAKTDLYSNLRLYDYSEFDGKKFQAVKTTFKNKTFKSLRFKNGKYDQCTFEDCIFKATGLSGTHFWSCRLKDFEILDSNMQFSDFSRNCILCGVEKTSAIYNSNMSQSMFQNVQIKNLKFKSTTVSQARFINANFKDVFWDFCTLQDDLFENVLMENISLIGCNLEYSEFKNIHFKNVKLPFHQLPYTFGLLDCLKDYSSEILIGAVASDLEPISTMEYTKLLPSLLSYYIDMNEYFPAINIALFCEQYERAEQLIETGLKNYIQTNDFRKIKGICKLIANHSVYDKHFTTQLYYKIIEFYNMVTSSEYEKYQYALHINDIKKLLTSFNEEIPTAQLYLKTNITSADIEKLGIFYQLIEQCLDDYNITNEEYTIEIRHNSDPLSFWITLSHQDPQVVITAVSLIMSVVTADPSFLQTALNVIANVATVGSLALQIGEAFKQKEKSATSDCPDVAANDKQYIKEKNDIIVNKEISINVSLPFFNFSYRNEKLYEHQN